MAELKHRTQVQLTGNVQGTASIATTGLDGGAHSETVFELILDAGLIDFYVDERSERPRLKIKATGDCELRALLDAFRYSADFLEFVTKADVVARPELAVPTA